MPKVSTKLTKKDIAMLKKFDKGTNNAQASKLLETAVARPMRSTLSEDEDKRSKLLFKISKIVERFPDNIIVRGIFNDNVTQKNVLAVLKKKKVADLEDINKNIRNNIILDSQASTSNDIPEHALVVSSVMIENIVGSFVNINGYSNNIKKQIETNEALRVSLDFYKLDAIDWFSMSPTSIIALAMCMGLMSTYQSNKMLDYQRLMNQKQQPTQPIRETAPPLLPPDNREKDANHELIINTQTPDKSSQKSSTDASPLENLNDKYIDL